MNTIEKYDLNIERQFNYGSFSNAYITLLGNQKYCYKEFTGIYPPCIINQIISLANRDFKEEYLTPKYIVMHHNHIVGYLSKLIYPTISFDDVWNRDKLIVLLKKLKELIIYMHKEYHLIHSDIKASNILVNELKELVYLIDFDASIPINGIHQTDFTLPTIACEYLKYYKCDERLDIYEFNLLTLELLSDNRDELYLESSFGYKDYELESDNPMVRKLCKELRFNDTRKPYSGEFIIDYL